MSAAMDKMKLSHKFIKVAIELTVAEMIYSVFNIDSKCGINVQWCVSFTQGWISSCQCMAATEWAR